VSGEREPQGIIFKIYILNITLFCVPYFTTTTFFVLVLAVLSFEIPLTKRKKRNDLRIKRFAGKT